MIIAYFRLDPDNPNYLVLGERHLVTDIVGSALATAAGGAVGSFGRIGQLFDKYFVLIEQNSSDSEMPNLDPDVFGRTALPDEDRTTYGILDLDIKFK